MDVSAMVPMIFLFFFIIMAPAIGMTARLLWKFHKEDLAAHDRGASRESPAAGKKEKLAA